ncbi:MAG TPA: TetR/AcrR family transcriptional regulator [Streptosporangiaceae bacterium]|nr:TetR/AcrR family transcriptional regulator [Streptosporangiaceae bacterium]
MARPRSFSTEDAVAAAAAVFWSKGYRDTAIADLEQATGLNRSSLYTAFGTKQAIFGLALRWYLRGFIGPRLAPMECPGAGPGDIEGFFAGLAAFFRADGQASRGCLMINTIAEDEGRGTLLGSQAQAFRDRLNAAFANAMAGQHDSGLVSQRAQLLTTATFGIWLTARIDPAGAAQACDATAARIRSWQQAPDGPDSLSAEASTASSLTHGPGPANAQRCNEDR